MCTYVHKRFESMNLERLRCAFGLASRGVAPKGRGEAPLLVNNREQILSLGTNLGANAYPREEIVNLSLELVPAKFMYIRR
jgi:hypothetical protein